MFDPYGHFGQTFQQIGEANNNINQYKICEVKPPSIEKVGSRLELLSTIAIQIILLEMA